MQGRLWPYLAPYLALVILAELGHRLPSLEAVAFVGRVGVPAPARARRVAARSVSGAA